jgi:hypothetical protein
MELTLLRSDILLIEFVDLFKIKNDMKLIYLIQEDLLIKDLMDFINGYKVKK